jgi:hypothetical protein
MLYRIVRFKCFARGNNALRPTGAPYCASLRLCVKSDKGFQFPAMTLDFLRIPQQGVALSEPENRHRVSSSAWNGVA